MVPRVINLPVGSQVKQSAQDYLFPTIPCGEPQLNLIYLFNY